VDNIATNTVILRWLILFIGTRWYTIIKRVEIHRHRQHNIYIPIKVYKVDPLKNIVLPFVVSSSYLLGSGKKLNKWIRFR
jgi:hypothetical protein